MSLAYVVMEMYKGNESRTKQLLLSGLIMICDFKLVDSELVTLTMTDNDL